MIGLSRTLNSVSSKVSVSTFEAFQVVILKRDDIGEAKKLIEFALTCYFVDTQKVRKTGKCQVSSSAYSLTPCSVGFGRNAFHSDEELAEAGEQALLPADKYLSSMQRFDLNPKREKAFCNGLSSTVKNFTAQTESLRVYADGHFIGVGRYDKEREELLPVKVLGR